MQDAPTADAAAVNGEQMVRFYTPSLYGACDALDLYDIDYDLDDGDRIMVDDSLYDAALDAFDEYDIEYEEV